MTAPDFEALRAKRNAAAREMLREIAEQQGWNFKEIRCNHNDAACYCACPTGPCEHRWDGEIYTSDDQSCQSTTCSRCGITSFNHDMRVME